LNNVMKQVLVWLVIALVVFTVFKQFDSRTARATSLAYSEFMDQAKSGRIKSAGKGREHEFRDRYHDGFQS